MGLVKSRTSRCFSIAPFTLRTPLHGKDNLELDENKITIADTFRLIKHLKDVMKNKSAIHCGYSHNRQAFTHLAMGLKCAGDTQWLGSLLNVSILALKVLVTTIDAQWEGMGDIGSARYEPALLPPCPTIRALSYSN